MRPPARILAIAAPALACAGVDLPGVPSCAEAELRPLPESACELGADVADYRRDTVLTVWGYVGSQSPRLPIVIQFDGRARIDAVCVEEAASVGWSVREPLDRAIRTLRAMPPGPACLAGRRLELAEDFADVNRGAPRKTWRPDDVEESCMPRPNPVLCAGMSEPVCALLRDGSRETYPDACEACRDRSALGYDRGICRVR